MKKIVYTLLIVCFSLILFSCASTDKVDTNPQIDIHREYILDNEKIVINSLPGVITISFPEPFVDADIYSYLSMASNSFPEFFNSITFSVVKSTIMLELHDQYTEQELNSILDQLASLISDVIIEDYEEKKSSKAVETQIATRKTIDEKTNNRMSFDPENYAYTFGLIPTEDLDIGFASHLYLNTTMLYGYPTVGGTWDMGIKVDTVTIAAYVRYEHLFKALGSTTGKLVMGEEIGEIGLSFNVRLYELGRFNVNLGINTGWYQQWLMFSSNAGTYNLVNNGLMIRPQASIGWNWIGWWNMEIGLYYQTPLYPLYSGFNGWGMFLKIF